MATVATLPFAKAPKGYNKDLKERPTKSLQPTRSMTHPIHDHTKPNNGKRRVKNGEPFDPEELSRRLTAYVAEQKAASQRRREARAAKERAAAIAAGLDPHDSVYRHVPTVAASAFHRTATPNLVTPETVHKLAAPVLKAALNPKNSDEALEHGSLPTRQRSTRRPSTSLQRTVQKDQAAVEKERIRNRNQFQRTQALEDAAEVDELRDVYRVPQRTFGEFAHLRNAQKGHARPLSMGDVFSDSEDTDTAPAGRLRSLRVKPVFEGRNDWAQEEVRSPKEGDREKGGTWNGRVKERVSGPFLKKKDSVWVLMGMKDREKSKVDESLVGTGIGEDLPSPTFDAKKSFLARFKRRPSS